MQIYLPGIDGTGLAAWQQFPLLVPSFALVSLSVPIADRTPFTDLVDICVAYLKQLSDSISSERPIYLMGESFGGLLAVAVASNCRDLVDRIVLVNPATSYEDSIWPRVWPVPMSVLSSCSDVIACTRRRCFKLGLCYCRVTAHRWHLTMQ